MKVICRHGHFAFYPEYKKEVSRFKTLFKVPLYAEDDYFTFESLLDLPRWSQILVPYGDLVGLVNYEARYPWQVMKQNSFVYSLALETLVPRVSITQMVSLPQTEDCIVAPKTLIQPGSIMSSGNVLLGYQGELDLNFQKLYIYAQETLT